MHIPRPSIKRPFIALTVLYILALILLNHEGSLSFVSKHDISHYISDNYAKVNGKIIDVPEQKKNTLRFVVQVFSVTDQKAGGKIRVTLFPGRAGGFHEQGIEQGDIITFYGKLLHPPSARNPGQFDYAAYLRRKNIYTITYVSSFNITGHIPLPFYQSAANIIRANMIDTIHRYLPQREASVLIPMLIGEKSELSEEEKQAFMSSGLMHILVVSGLNVAYVVAIFLGFFRMFGFKRRTAALLTIPFILLFMLIAGDNPPVVRATVMALFVILSLSLSREPLIYQSLAMAAMSILIFDPQALFNASFQLSFAATMGIVYLYPYLIKPFQKLPGWIQNYVGGTIAVSFAAQLAVLPIIAYYFNKISLIGLASNIPVVPLSGIITALGIVLYLAHFVSHFIAMPFALFSYYLVQGMLWCVHVFAGVPFAAVHVATPSIPLILGYYIFLIGIFHIRKIPLTIGAMVAGSAAVICISLWVIPSRNQLTATSLYAGDGTAVHIAFPDGKNWLIDTGRNRGDGEKIICPYLRSKGIHGIDKVIITSDDKHHCGGLETVIDNFAVSEVIYPYKNARNKEFSGLPTDSKARNISADEIRSLKQYHISGSTLTIAPCVSLRDNSLIVVLDYAGRRIVFTHQGNMPPMNETLQYVREKPIDILHVSSQRKQTDIFRCVELLKPGAVLLSGRVPEERIEAGNVYSLKNSGAVTVVIGSGRIRILTFCGGRPYGKFEGEE